MIVDLPSRAGERDAELVVLFVHAISLSAGCYVPLAAGLSVRSLNLGLQLPGHGGAPEPPAGTDPWTAFAEAVGEAVEVLKERVGAPIVVVAHSGGATSALLAEQRSPLSVAGMYLYEPALRPPAPLSPRAETLIEKTRGRAARFPDRNAAHAHASAMSPTRTFAPPAIEGFLGDGLVEVADEGWQLACAPAFEAEIYRLATRNSCWAELSSVMAEVRLAYGTGGPSGGLGEIAPDILRRLPNARGDAIPGAGHFAPCEQIAMIAASIDRFASELLSAVGDPHKKPEPQQ